MSEPTLREKEIVAHYRRFLGKETRIVRFDGMPEPAPSTIRVLEYAPEQDGDAWAYTTVGVSDKPMPVPGDPAPQHDDHRIELVLYSATQQEELIDALHLLAAYPFVHNTFLSWGHMIAGSPGNGIVEGSPLTEILLSRPYLDGMDIIHHEDGTHTQLLWVVPIHLSERMYAREHGHGGLEELFGEREIDSADLWRPPVV
jgi:hypothetical protein